MLFNKILIGMFLFVMGCSSGLKNSPPSVLTKKESSVAIVQPVSKSPSVLWREVDSTTITEAAITGKLLVIVFTDDKHCGICREMKRTTFANSAIVASLNENFIPVMADGEDYFDLMKKLGVKEIPSSVFMLCDGTVVANVSGYLDSESYSKILNMFVH